MRRRAGFQPPADFEAVHVGHHHVEEDEIAFGALADGQRLLPAHRGNDVEILCRQPCFKQPHVGRNVVNDQNTRSHSLAFTDCQESAG